MNQGIKKREFWQYRRFWFGALVLLLALRYFGPHIANLRGWQKSFSRDVIELSLLDIPENAKRIGSLHEIEEYFGPALPFDLRMARVSGPILVAAWNCKAANKPSACLRYIWRGEQLTLVISRSPEGSNATKGAFSHSGQSGQIVVKDEWAAAFAGPIDAKEIKNAWPYSK